MEVGIKSKRKRIRDLPAPKRSHPKYEEQIKTEGWAPLVLCDAEGAYWNGFAVRDRNKKTFSAITPSAREQLINMMLSGYFGEEVKDVLLDETAWWRVYDRLIDVPDAQAIKRESLSELRLEGPNYEG